jgi:hypothetical protein
MVKLHISTGLGFKVAVGKFLSKACLLGKLFLKEDRSSVFELSGHQMCSTGDRSVTDSLTTIELSLLSKTD